MVWQCLAPVMPPAVTWSPALPVRFIEEVSAVKLLRLTDDVVIVDFGQKASGRLRRTSLGPPDTRTILDYGAHLGPDGDLTLTHLGAEASDGSFVDLTQRDVIMADGGITAAFEPCHTVHGFRFMQALRTRRRPCRRRP